MEIAVIANEAIERGKKIYIRGFSVYGFDLNVFFKSCDIEIEGYMDNNSLHFGKKDNLGKRCFPNSVADESCFVFVTVQNPDYVKDIVDELSRKGSEYILLSYDDIFENLCRIEDERYLKVLFWQKIGYDLDLDDPKTFNEKIQWLKLYDRRPEYTIMADKYSVKKYVADKIGEQYIIPTLGVWDHFDDIDFDTLPEQFVLKCTHDSGSIIVCKNKSMFDRKAAKERLEKCLNVNYYFHGREWVYKNIKPRIIAEVLLSDKTGNELKDYKFFCYNGEPIFMFIASERMKNDETKFDFFDMNFNHLPFTNGHPNSNFLPDKPKNFEKMKQIARVLSKNIPHIRLDFYELEELLYFGEYTFYHWSGFVPFVPEKWDRIIGDHITLPSKYLEA